MGSKPAEPPRVPARTPSTGAPVQQDGQQFISAFEHAPIGMTLLGPDLCRLRANRAFCRLVGYDEHELLNVPVGSVVHPEDVGECAAAMHALVVGDIEVLQREQRYVHRSGAVLWGHVTCSVVRDIAGRPLYLVAQVLDVTSRHEAHASLRASEERFRSLTLLMSDWYWEQDEEYRFTTFWGEPRQGCWAPDRQGSAGKRRWELDGVDPTDASWAQHRAVLDARQPFRDFEYCRRVSGELRVLSASGEPVYDERGIFRGYRGVARDITEQRLAQQRLSEAREESMRAVAREVRRANDELEERVQQRTAQLAQAIQELEAFSYSIAHDLRAPLSSIDGFSRVLEETCAGIVPERGRHCIARIRAGVSQMSELTDGLLALARFSQEPMRHEAVDISALARRAVTACAEREPQRDVEARIDAGIVVQGDPTLLSQVVGNLVGNAWKFTRHVDRACIEVLSEGASAGTFIVRDNGAGFDMAHASRLFQPFHRMHGAAEFPGNGIGLAIVHRIITRHEGSIDVRTAPQQGACFRVVLPAAHV